MDKSGVIVGGVFGAVAVLVIFAILLVPPTSIEPPSKELVVSNGHGPSTVGETTPISSTKKLSLIEIFERTESGTVRVEVKRASQVSGSNGVGSGFVFDRSGHIITNAHVIDDAKKIIVTFLDGRSYNAEIIGKDPFTDIAVVKVDAARELLNPLSLGDSSNLKVGEQIADIGNPFGLSGSMTSGIVSQLGRL